ncbi:MAG: 16S rRNA methyltransferase [Epulopiscium sp. Nele67-Bin002]|nr:MAG: 16S rRNA methyltransferase [Epulopiscium sp. Nele67-Bin002]OOO00301.1 MAG: 16S rRNA (adenine(1518)-N(6)/adenine(1519)-N(6))-dimethyltransferase [Epulopiscium sp. Nele67-Bin004]
MIGTAEGTKQILNKYPFVFQKKFGQNFLIDPHVLQKIIGSAQITEEDCIIEIGPGIGSVTEQLLQHAGKVISIEIDNQLIPILEEQFGSQENFKLVHGDVLKVDLHELIEKEAQGRKVKVVANLPYYITTPIIMMLLENNLKIDSIVVMVQKEVAVRMAAEPGNKLYGAITAAMNYYCETYLVANVPQNCFMPRPNVDSAVIKLTLHENPPIKVQNEKLLFAIIKASFAQRRKTLLNTLSSNLGISKEELKQLLDKAEIDSNVRGETLGLKEFAHLADIIDANR